MNTNRRDFFKLMTQFIGTSVLFSLGLPAHAEERRRGGGGGEKKTAGGSALEELSPSKDAAKAVNYSLKHSNVKKPELKVERQGVAFDKQFCDGCSFYKKHSNKGAKELGTCQIFPNQLVEAKAWCSSWNKKA